METLIVTLWQFEIETLEEIQAKTTDKDLQMEILIVTLWLFAIETLMEIQVETLKQVQSNLKIDQVHVLEHKGDHGIE